MFGDKLKNFWQSNLEEIQQNKFRFAAVCICFVVAVALFLSDDTGGEQIILEDNPAPVETVELNKKVVPIKTAATSNLGDNVKVVLGANPDKLYVFDPFKVPPKPKVETPPPVPEIPPPIPQPQEIIIPPPVVAQVPPPPSEKFILRGTAIVGDNKSAILQNSAEENLIVEIGENLNGKIILDITPDSLTFDDGETLYLDLQN